MLALASPAFAKQHPTDEPGALSHVGQINLGLAQGYYASNDLETALDHANKALRTDPRSAEVHALLGLIYSRVSQQDKAAGEFKRALELAPTSGSILNINGVWLCQQGRAVDADAAFTKALQDPFYKEPEQALSNAGKCAYKAGQLKNAEAYLRASLQKSPDQPEALFTMAQVQFAQGNYMDARAFIQRRDALGSGPEILDLAARIEDAAGDHRAAEQYRQRSHDNFPNASATAGDGVKQP
jgi:type IV pilus assembly protein PilF